MEADGVAVEKTTEEIAEETGSATDHMAEMAAAMEADGVAVETDSGGRGRGG
jgi:hypothetical protein